MGSTWDLGVPVTFYRTVKIGIIGVSGASNSGNDSWLRYQVSHIVSDDYAAHDRH